MPAATTDQPVVRVSPTTKAALRAAQETLTAATGRPAVLGAIVDDILAVHLTAYVAARLQALQPVAAPSAAPTDGGR